MNAVSTWRAGAALFGKAPWNEEYLRPSKRVPALRSMDEWLFRNARAMAVPPRASPASERTYGFLLNVDANAPLQAVAGALTPSEDKAGREYPLAVAASVDLEGRVGNHPELTPILFESYWEIASDALVSFRHAPPAADDRRLEQSTEAPLESAATALELYARWATETPVGDLCSLVGRPVEWLAVAARRVLDLASNRGPARSPFALRVPLGEAAGSALCFWLDVLRRSALWEGHAPSFFWTQDGSVGEAVLCLGTPGDSVLAAMWRDDAPEESICDLAQTESLTTDRQAGSFAGEGPRKPRDRERPDDHSSSGLLGAGLDTVSVFLDQLQSGWPAASMRVSGPRETR
jgi:type VI secretion system ImpM family protein